MKSHDKAEFSAVKTFNLSDLDGRTLHIVVTADTDKESGLTTRVAFGRDVESGEMFVLSYEVNNHHKGRGG